MNVPATVELLALTAFVVVYPTLSAWGWPAFVRKARAGAAGIRIEAYVEVLVVQWSLTALVLWSWHASGRPWARLGLGAPRTAAWIGLAAVVVLATVVALGLRGLDRLDAAQRQRVVAQLGDTLLLLPHDARENRWFRAVAGTAGTCEEVIYRGALPVLLGTWLPHGWALVGASVLFGMGHAYQGARAIVKVVVVGAILATITELTGSLWTAMALHVLLDLHGGAVGYAATKGER